MFNSWGPDIRSEGQSHSSLSDLISARTKSNATEQWTTMRCSNLLEVLRRQTAAYCELLHLKSQRSRSWGHVTLSVTCTRVIQEWKIAEHYIWHLVLPQLVNDWRRIYFRNHSLMSYSDDYVSVDLAITFVILDTLNIFLIDWLIDWSWRSISSVSENCGFCRAMLCISVTYAAVRCPSVCLSVTFVYAVKIFKHFYSRVATGTPFKFFHGNIPTWTH